MAAEPRRKHVPTNPAALERDLSSLSKVSCTVLLLEEQISASTFSGGKKRGKVCSCFRPFLLNCPPSPRRAGFAVVESSVALLAVTFRPLGTSCCTATGSWHNWSANVGAGYALSDYLGESVAVESGHSVTFFFQHCTITIVITTSFLGQWYVLRLLKEKPSSRVSSLGRSGQKWAETSSQRKERKGEFKNSAINVDSALQDSACLLSFLISGKSISLSIFVFLFSLSHIAFGAIEGDYATGP